MHLSRSSHSFPFPLYWVVDGSIDVHIFLHILSSFFHKSLVIWRFFCLHSRLVYLSSQVFVTLVLKLIKVFISLLAFTFIRAILTISMTCVIWIFLKCCCALFCFFCTLNFATNWWWLDFWSPHGSPVCSC